MVIMQTMHEIAVHVDLGARSCLAVAGQMAARINARVVAVGPGRVDGFEWVAEWRQLDRPSDFLSHARHADLAVMEQDRALAAEVIMNAGRPILVVPRFGDFTKTGQTVMVAWDGSRGATRAVFDALAILQAAAKVVVLSLDDASGQTAGADIATMLARHGVNVEIMRSSAGDIDVGNALLSRLAEIGADLLVMGAFSRHPLREKALGGATHHILGHMTVPVLFSH
jgi:nucleotide-binding universal stress UspA family protein